MNPKVTIITVCLNSEALIEKTLQSVASQDYPYIEYLIIDGGSTDSTLSILEKYKSKISSIISEKDNGIYDAMNKGIALSTGDLIYFLNSGDYLYDDQTIKHVIKKVEEFPAAEIYTGDIFYYDKDGAERLSGNKSGPIDMLARVITHQAILARKVVFEKYGDFDTKYRIYADYDWLLKAVLENHAIVHYLGIPIAYYLKSGLSDRMWKNYLHERRDIVTKYTSKQQMICYMLKYPGDGFRYTIHRFIGYFIKKSKN